VQNKDNHDSHGSPTREESSPRIKREREDGVANRGRDKRVKREVIELDD
jgi:hypothetical protein